MVGCLAVTVCGIVLAVAVAFLIAKGDGGRTVSRPDVAAAMGSGPCLSSQPVSLDQLWSRSPDLPSIMPHDELAGKHAVTGVWSCARGSAAVVKFDSGLQMSMDHGWDESAGRAQSLQFAFDWGDGKVQLVGGREALVIPVGSDVAKGQVLFFDGGTLVTIDGNGMQSTGDLTRVAGTIN